MSASAEPDQDAGGKRMPSAVSGGVLLQVDGLTIDLPESADRPFAVENISLQLHRNEILCVVGESGSGKSMTAQAIMGLLPGPLVKASAGQILFNGHDLLKMSQAEIRAIRGRDIAMIFQEPMTALNPVVKVGAQIAEGIRAHVNLSNREIDERVVQLLASVQLPNPESIRNAYPFRLSGGQRQRVLIAMALALEPSILIADEPTTALDVTTQAQILRLIRDIQVRQQMAVLFVTHDFGVVADIADRIAVMREGRIVEMGVTQDTLNTPKHPYTQDLIAAVPRPTPTEQPNMGKQPTLLVMTGLHKKFGGGWGLNSRRRRTHAVNNVNLRIRRGETVGLVGESGSGKSTFARCVVRLVSPDAGKIEFEGLDIGGLSGANLRRFRSKVQMVFQDPYASLNPRHTVGRIITSGPRAHGVDKHNALNRANEILLLVGLDPAIINRYPHEFSGGQRQRISLARALIMQPEILVADEPLSALDVSVQSQVLKLLNDTRRRYNLAMLFITHDLRVAAEVSDTVAVMREGKIVEYGSTFQVFARPSHPYTRELLEAIPGRNWSIAR